MTFEQLAKKYLLQNGASETQAAEIIAWAKRDEFLSLLDWKATATREEVFILALRTVATEYIEEVMPQAWFRHRFASL